ncbi:MAG: SDR family NAD(P)-dependent oxidoreductase [Actinobacteria bacterium]|nr:SDR family NAD(P)-dependent oxidoreductase [Actinomycetota bacterium]
MKKLDGKRAVITGAASGLGRATAVALARRGCHVGVVDIDLEGAEETLGMVRAAGGSGEIYELDVRVAMDWEAMAEHFFSSWGGVDLLVNNAGVVSTGYVGDIPLEDWEWIFSINFWGMLYGCHFFLPRMKRQGHGHILNVASAAGIFNLLEMAPYNTTKAAVISLSETLREELAPEGIGITVLCPMFFNTNLLNTMRYTDEFEPEFARTTFEHARMTADEVAEAAIRAVEKGKLYCVPQFSGRFLWVIKRFSPGVFQGAVAFGNRFSWGKKVFMWMARKGLLQ